MDKRKGPLLVRGSGEQRAGEQPDRSDKCRAARRTGIPMPALSLVERGDAFGQAGLLTSATQDCYSGGTVRDFHPLPYSPGRLHASPGTMPGFIKSRFYFSPFGPVCQWAFFLTSPRFFRTIKKVYNIPDVIKAHMPVGGPSRACRPSQARRATARFRLAALPL